MIRSLFGLKKNRFDLSKLIITRLFDRESNIEDRSIQFETEYREIYLQS